MSQQFESKYRRTCLWSLVMATVVIVAIVFIAYLVLSPRTINLEGDGVPVIATYTPEQ